MVVALPSLADASLCGFRPSLCGFRPSLCGFRPRLVVLGVAADGLYDLVYLLAVESVFAYQMMEDELGACRLEYLLLLDYYERLGRGFAFFCFRRKY